LERCESWRSSAAA
jgi:hypothetical protein